MYEDFKLSEKSGITAIIINKKRILLLKRVNVPFIYRPGRWSFVSGGSKKGEDYIQTAYREINEEIGIDPKNLELLSENKKITIVDPGKKAKWENGLFIFCSKTDSIRINMEHTDYKWVSFEELKRHDSNLDSIIEKEQVVQMLEKCVAECDK